MQDTAKFRRTGDAFVWRILDSLLKRLTRITVFYRLVKAFTNMVVYYRGPKATERIVEYPFVLNGLRGLDQEGSRILDVGSGYATFTAELAALAYDVYAIDLLDYPTRHENLNFVRGSILHAPFASEAFDAVICVSTLEHLGLYGFTVPLLTKQGDILAMEEMIRLTKRGGAIFVTVPFGKPYTAANYRVYDFHGLNERVVRDLKVEEMATYFYKNGQWRSCTPEEAQNMESFPGTYAVACLRLRT